MDINLINKAIKFAEAVHHTQFRKGTDIPYITHPLAVALILSRVTEDDNIIAAGILHDTVEDCKPYGSVTREMISKEFNEEIARMVDDVTEKDKSKPWKERKQEAIAHIPHMSNDSLLLKSADVLHNLMDMNEDIKREGDKAFGKYNAGKEDKIWQINNLIPAIENKWPENPLLPDLIALHSEFLSLTHQDIAD